MKSRLTAEYRTDGEKQLTVGDIRTMIAGVPDEALVSAIRIDKGTQRDPWPVLVGLRAAWEEES